MGIQGLMKLLNEECPQAIKELDDMENLTGCSFNTIISIIT